MVVTGHRLLVSTAPADVAPRLARTLVEERLAACVNILPGARSIYSWKGEVCDDAESLLFVKTTAEAVEALRKRLVELHPYELPEAIVFDIRNEESSPEYLAWLESSVG